jgi:uncharacterized membrane protein
MSVLKLCVLIAFAALVNTPLMAQQEYSLRLIKNSKSFSQVIAVNASLQVIGVREVEEGPSMQLRNFFRSGEDELEIKPPKGFTNLEVQALSDNGLVVGYVSRPLGSEEGSLQSFVWNSQSKEVTLLPLVPNDTASNAQDISADGLRITGYSLGSNPPRMRPCVWSYHAEDNKWMPQILETILDRNPYLQASQVVISPNGKVIAACITEQQISELIYDSSLYVWQLESDGSWKRQKVSDEQPKLKDINDEGVTVGSLNDGESARAFRCDLSGKIERFELLPGDHSSIAYGITNGGVVVGVSDDPPGNDGGPQAFIWKSGVLSPLPLPAGTVDSAALTINQQGVVGGFVLLGAGEEEVTTAFLGIPAKEKQ